MSVRLSHPDRFVSRHLGPTPGSADLARMLETLGAPSLDRLIEETVPASIRVAAPMNLGFAALSEAELLARAAKLGGENRVFRSYIGQGYSDTITPPVILRNIVQNPGWYTQYTPYQAEIAQGRLEALLNYQTMITDLTGLEIANASLLDEATAAAEAMYLAHGFAGSDAKNAFFVADDVHPQSLEVIRTRAEALGFEVRVGSVVEANLDGVFGALVQYPTTFGDVIDYKAFGEKVHAAGALFVVAADLLALVLLAPPSSFGADVCVGSSQRFGVPLGYGGPHAAFFATKNEYLRKMPGRIIGVSQDAHGKPALRMALQTREQHIRREKATSNICTAQALLAIVAGMYAVYHGPEGLRGIAEKVHGTTAVLARALRDGGKNVLTSAFFDTLVVEGSASEIAGWHATGLTHGVNFRKVSGTRLAIAIDETTGLDELRVLFTVFGLGAVDPAVLAATTDVAIPAFAARTGEILSHPIFHAHRSETEMLRYLRKLEGRDLSLCHSMIPLGSCTMKLNATAEMMPITDAPWNRLHPYVPVDQARGYQVVFEELSQWLATITGFHGVSLQPNAGAQGEYAGLLVIKRFHESRNEGHRNVCLIPSSAHGTNPASAVIAGFEVVVVACDANGNVDVTDLKAKADQYKDRLGALMITYPSTHGVFEEAVKEICAEIHARGGQVYMDGANMNAQVGLTGPGHIGADVCHLNLHKTFCIPHGGGGPGMGPICVAEHLTPFLPKLTQIAEEDGIRVGAVSAAPYGSASILLISWAYIQMMGADGLTDATKIAIANANYIAARLAPHFPVVYKGTHGRVAHECILDMRPFKKSAGIEVDDIAKRLMDYGFHAPTMSFPIPGTLMIEPTESESLGELDRFCEAMIAIREEIRAVEDGRLPKEDNPLKNAPHTIGEVTRADWNHPYSRELAAFPTAATRDRKFFPFVGRLNNALGDRKLICTCPPIESYQTA
jgi:glycine dehydrogenase